MNRQIIIRIVFLMLCSHYMVAQDGLFSQFMQSKSFLNPSTFSLSNDPLTIQLQYREQGASVSDGLPLRTFLANVNYASYSFNEDKMSFGLSVLGDKGGLGHLSKSLAHLNFSYLKRLSGKYASTGIHFLGIGVQAGGGQHSSQWNRFWFGNQFNVEYGYVDTSLDSGEPEIGNSANGISPVFYDINAGINWYSYINESFSAYAGYAMFHLNRPNISFFDNQEDRLLVRNTIHAGLVQEFESGFLLKPKVFFSRQGVSSQLIIGTDVGLDNDDVFEIAMDFGVYTRFVNHFDGFGTDAIIMSLNLGYEQFNFSLAYDLTISRLSKYNGSKGAWELMLRYAIPNQKRSFNRSEIKFRF